MDEPSNSLNRYLDGIELTLKKTGVGARVEIIAYPDGHAGIGTHPLNGKQELLSAIDHLFERARNEAVAAAAGVSTT